VRISKLEQGKELGRQEESKEWLKRLIPFPDYYKERLEYWKKRVGEELKSSEHRIILILAQPSPYPFAADRTLEERGCISPLAAQQQIADLKNELDKGHAITFAGQTIGNKYVIRIEFVEGHPDPYTPEEIEVRVKEGIETEMQGWKVVRREETQAGPISATVMGLAGLYRDMCQQHPWWI